MSKRRQPKPTERVPQLPELGEKGFRLLQILGVEALGKPAVDRGQQLIGVLALALTLPQAGEAHHSLKLEQLCRLATGNIYGALEGGLCCVHVAQPTFEQDFSTRPMELGKKPAVSRPLYGRKLRIESGECPPNTARFRLPLGPLRFIA